MITTKMVLMPLLDVLLLLSLISSVSLQPSLVSPLVVDEKLLWISGQDDVGVYRIPLLTYTPGGSLLAICEARKSGSADQGSKFLAIRRSDDRGQTWKPQQYVLDDGPTVKDGLNLGAVVVDDITKTIFIIYETCGHHTHGCKFSTTHYIKSVDDGYAWSKAYNLSEQIGTRTFAGGPGYGIQKKFAPHKGRLVVCGHGGQNEDGLFCILSDDHGEHWRYGGMVKGIPYNQSKVKGDFEPDECQPVEFSDGSIMVNVRNQLQYHCHCRMIFMSYNGGDSFAVDDLRFDTTLVDPAVAASILYHRGVLFFTNPENDAKRVNMTLRWSYDNGMTWASSLSIWPKASGYSTMTAFPNDIYGDKFIYILYEKGVTSSIQFLSFAKVSLSG